MSLRNRGTLDGWKGRIIIYIKGKNNFLKLRFEKKYYISKLSMIDDRGNFQKFNVSLYEIFPKLDLLENKILKERIVTCFEDTLYIIIIFAVC